ncbi:MAG: ribosome biogenesis GTP-binding protein YsxC [Clostridiaceae bacterium]|nr:ribosome biogenesis GTP-binding protein YsxC [Clostridiaceae bacterium]
MKNKIEFVSLITGPDKLPRDGRPEVVLAGRSNAGKSSLLNALGGSRQLAKVSSVPGKTRFPVLFLVDDSFYITDLPGYGYVAGSPDKHREYDLLADNYLTTGRELALILLVMDIRQAPAKNDRIMLEWLEYSGYRYAYILNKSDKLSRAQSQRRLQEFRSCLPESQREIPTFVASTTKGDGIVALREYINSLIG